MQNYFYKPIKLPVFIYFRSQIYNKILKNLIPKLNSFPNLVVNSLKQGFYRNKIAVLHYFYQNFLLICMAFHLRWVIFQLRWANFYSGRANYQLRWTFFQLRWANFELRWTNFHSLWISFHLLWISFQNFNALIWKIIVNI